MKRAMRPERVDELLRWAALVGVDLVLSDATVLLEYLECVLRANERVNLTSVSRVEDAVRIHIVDSLTALPEVESAGPGTLVDVGSGAGFPGVPLCVASSRPTVLLESVAKKAGATKSCCVETMHDYPVSVASERSEAYARRCPREASVAVSRAVSGLPTVLELSAPLLAIGGSCVAMAGSLTEQQRQSGAEAASLLGMREDSVRTLALPGGGEERTILLYRVVKEAEITLPRREGLAAKRPIA